MVLSMNCNGCVVDETVDSSGASAVRKNGLVLDKVQTVVCASPRRLVRL